MVTDSPLLGFPTIKCLITLAIMCKPGKCRGMCREMSVIDREWQTGGRDRQGEEIDRGTWEFRAESTVKVNKQI